MFFLEIIRILFFNHQNKRTPVSIMVCAVKKIYNENVTLENSNLGGFYSFGEKSELFFKLWSSKGPGISTIRKDRDKTAQNFTLICSKVVDFKTSN